MKTAFTYIPIYINKINNTYLRWWKFVMYAIHFLGLRTVDPNYLDCREYIFNEPYELNLLFDQHKYFIAWIIIILL